MEILRQFKNKLKEGRPVYGPFMITTDPAFIEIAGHSGFDFVVIDMEHGPVGFTDLQNLIRAALLAGILPLVRTPDFKETSITKSLDTGALGILIPQVSSAEIAKQCINSARFFPKGTRGLSPFVRAARYSSMPVEEYLTIGNESLMIIQIEGKEAILDIDNILNIEGIDIIFIGPYDLSQSLGVPGQVNHLLVIEAMEYIVKQAHSKGICVGTFTDTISAVEMWKKAGVQFISYSGDVSIFTNACSQLVKELQHLK